MDIAKIFNKFAGKEVKVEETQSILSFGGQIYAFSNVKAAANDPTLKAMEEAANENGFALRVWFSGASSRCDYRTDRVNIHVLKGPDGKYRVSDKINIG